MSRKITLTEKKEKRRGTGKNGKEYVIYAYYDGANWFDSFDDFPLNQEIEVEYTPNSNPEWNANISKLGKTRPGGLTQQTVEALIEAKLEPIYKKLNMHPDEGKGDLPF